MNISRQVRRATLPAESQGERRTDMKRPRYVLEGTWSGYRASQRKIVHREVIRTPKLYEHLHTIKFTDNTLLELKIRQCEPRERVKEVIGYRGLIDTASRSGKGFVSVEELLS